MRCSPYAGMFFATLCATTSLHAATFTVLHTFSSGKQSVHQPMTGLAKLGGALYGTTEFGKKDDGNFGTVFKIIPDGQFRVVYSFSGGADGAYPNNPLLAYNGLLYGTSGYSPSILYSLTKDGQQTVLHDFGSSGDGSAPVGRLVELNGTLYGTTELGGANDNGTVYSITPQGQYSIVYSFGAPGDGNEPIGSLVALDGTLYGVTFRGGSSGNGTVFAITPEGKEAVLYSFTGHQDGENPEYGLVSLQGRLFGTTNGGDLPNCANCGTVFSITPKGYYHIVHRFHVDSNGFGPGALTVANGQIYGTTESAQGGYGAAFSLSPSGTYTLLHTFDSVPDGAFPNSPLTYDNGTLYGTTESGGLGPDGNVGGGTVFALTP